MFAKLADVSREAYSPITEGTFIAESGRACSEHSRGAWPEFIEERRPEFIEGMVSLTNDADQKEVKAFYKVPMV